MLRDDNKPLKPETCPIMAAAYKPAQQENAMLRTGFYVTGICMFFGIFILMLTH